MIIKAIALLVVAALGGSAAMSSSLSVSYFTIDSDKVDSPVKFVLVTDFHSRDYGENQRELINAIDAQSPDAVMLAGDIFDDVLAPGNTIEFMAAYRRNIRAFTSPAITNFGAKKLMISKKFSGMMAWWCWRERAKS